MITMIQLTFLETWNLSDVRCMRELLIQTYANVYIFQELFRETR